ncbi:MAG: hypothetical protein K6E30_06580 [Lachnospiraceae bacterium]|nr:hypothetical protein [Lachnospiraceae bacterium]
MSRKKVEAYKEYKKNKDKILKKEKLMKRLEAGAAALILAAFVGWFGYSVYDSVSRAAEERAAAGGVEVTTTELNLTDFTDYLNGLTLSY